MDCSIIIRAYNEEQHIARLLDGISHQTVRNVETILVDSGSTDQTAAITSGFPVNILPIAPVEFSFGAILKQSALKLRKIVESIQQVCWTTPYARYANNHWNPSGGRSAKVWGLYLE